MGTISLRLTDEQENRLRRDADTAGMKLSDWVRFCCLKEAPREKASGSDETPRQKSATNAAAPRVDQSSGCAPAEPEGKPKSNLQEMLGEITGARRCRWCNQPEPRHLANCLRSAA